MLLTWIASALGLLLLGVLLHYAGEWLELRRVRREETLLEELAGRHPGLRLAVETLWVHQRVRCCYVYRPRRPRGGPCPLILAFHGGEGTAPRLARQTRLHQIGEREGAVVVFPAARRYWNDGRRTTARECDDLAFVHRLIDRLVLSGEADPERIYATGVSNGGLFVLRLACELSNRIAAFAAVLASMPEDSLPRCRDARPAALMLINGTADRFVPWEGGEIMTGRHRGRGGRVIPVEETAEFWRRRNGCWSARRVRPLRTPSGDGPPLPVERISWSGCRQGAPLVLVRILGGGHYWPGAPLPPRQSITHLVGRVSTLNASELIWSFFAPIQLAQRQESLVREDDAGESGTA